MSLLISQNSLSSPRQEKSRNWEGLLEIHKLELLGNSVRPAQPLLVSRLAPLLFPQKHWAKQVRLLSQMALLHIGNLTTMLQLRKLRISKSSRFRDPSGHFPVPLISPSDLSSLPSRWEPWVRTMVRTPWRCSRPRIQERSLSTNSSKIILLIKRFYSIGTSKTTSHIPGYGGFIPKTDINDKAIG
jgi:hypothetical protein